MYIMIAALMLFLFVCLSFLGSCTREAWVTTNPPKYVEPPAWKCKLVVGDPECIYAEVCTQVWSCWDPATNKCWYVSNNGRIVQTMCVQHPIAE
jgi:hypothetical protein